MLEKLFTAPAAERTAELAQSMLMPAWSELVEKDPTVLEIFTAEAEKETFFTSARRLIDSYFVLEYPEHLEPEETEKFVRTKLDNGLELRGFIDRVDVAPAVRPGWSTIRPASSRSRSTDGRRGSRWASTPSSSTDSPEISSTLCS